MKVFSNSKIESYQQCPRKFKLHYIDKIPVPKEAQNVETLIGSCVHNALRELYQNANNGTTFSKNDLILFFVKEWDKKIQTEIIIPRKGLSLDHFKSSGISMLEKYFDHYAPFDQSQTIALEKRIQFPLDEYELTGFIDRVSLGKGEVFEIHDYKTTSSYPTITDLENDYQLPLYQIGISSLFPNVKKVVLIWHFLKFDTEIAIFKTTEQLESIKNTILSWIRKILHDPCYPPIEGPLCDWCLFQEYCSAKTHARDVLSYSSMELNTGSQIVDEYAKIQQLISQLNQKKVILEETSKEIEQRAIRYAIENQYTKLEGKNHSLQIIDEYGVEFPKTNALGRVELESWIKSKNMWDQVSMLQIAKLTKLLKTETLPKNIHDELMSFSQVSHTQKVKLIKTKNENLAVEMDETD